MTPARHFLFIDGFLSYHNIDDFTGNYDDLADILSIKPFGSAFMSECGLLYLFLTHIGGNLYIEAGLAIERYGIVDRRFLEIFLIPLRPPGIADGCITAESRVPEFLGDMGSEWCEYYKKIRQHLTRMTLHLCEFVDADHECRHRSIVGEGLYIACNFLDKLVD